LQWPLKDVDRPPLAINHIHGCVVSAARHRAGLDITGQPEAG